VCHHRCGGILDDGLAFVVKYGQLSTRGGVLFSVVFCKVTFERFFVVN
jgi:hypothetical protein